MAAAQMRLLYSLEKGAKPVSARMDVEVVKADLPARRVFGWGSIAVTKDGRQLVDTDEEIIEAPDLEEAAYLFVQEYGAGGVDHNGEAPLASVIESMYFDTEKTAAMGVPDGVLPQSGWWIGMEFADTPAGMAAWQSVANGERAMLSIEGRATTEVLA